MGRRSAAQSLVAIFAAFVEQRRWSQRDLAERVELQTRALRKVLDLLGTDGGLPLQRDEEGGQVFWTLPERWLPEGVALPKRDAELVVRYVARAKVSAERDRLLERLLAPTVGRHEAGLHPRDDLAESKPTILSILEDARARRVPVQIRYAPATAAGAPDEAPRPWRVLSVHHVAYGEHERIVALQAGKGDLHIYRVDRVLEARLAPESIFREVEPSVLAAYLATAIDGFHGGGGGVRCAFQVADPEARWVKTNLPMRTAQVAPIAGGVHVEVTTAAVTVLARFVLGLGAAARVETPELRAEIERLARGALASLKRAGAKKAGAKVGTKQASVKKGSRGPK